MTEETSKPPTITENLPSIEGGVSAIASASAPFIYFDGVPNFGVNNGVVNITLEALRFQPGGGAVVMDRVLVAHLRMSVSAAEALKDGVTKAIAMLAPPDDPAKVN